MRKRPPGKLRIIGGEHRSRIVEFDGDSGVRPTPDRVRQTVFDWLAPVIDGARVLDLFAGSGALGLEALSRGAAHVTFVETGAQQNTLIKEALLTLKIPHNRFDVAMMDALYYLTQTWHRYGVVFLDPPFETTLLQQALVELPKILSPYNRIYLEWPEGRKPELPAGFEWLREKQAGKVCFGLATCHLEKS
ncbi:MAG: 16S rRNA (guanine(966)-N(2))-methyltransferase RsmD [Stenotrophobium sp.]